MMPSEYIRLCTVRKSQVEDMDSAPEADQGWFWALLGGVRLKKNLGGPEMIWGQADKWQESYVTRLTVLWCAGEEEQVADMDWEGAGMHGKAWGWQIKYYEHGKALKPGVSMSWDDVWMLADKDMLGLSYKGDNEMHMVDRVYMLCMINVKCFSAHSRTFWPEENVHRRGEEEKVADIAWERGWDAWDDLRLTNKIEVTWGRPIT